MSNPDGLSPALKQSFIRLIVKQTGIEIRVRDQAALAEKIELRRNALQLASPEAYYHLLESSTPDSHQEWQTFIVLITNVESYFFRDKEQFNLLRHQILPELIERNQNTKTLRICSAGCSTGEEPYSLAILLKELLPPLEKWNLVIWGIDINQDALQKAKLGIYRPWSFRTIEPKIKQRYFKIIDNHYHIDQQIKQLIKFKPLNLVTDPFPQKFWGLEDFDLILCRNVFIYFEPSTITKILAKFHQALHPFGYLITGHAELYGQTLTQFQTKVFPESLVYQRQGENYLDVPFVSLPSEPNYRLVKDLSEELPNRITTDQSSHFPTLPGHSTQSDFSPKDDLESAFAQNTIKMQQAALNLLKQLPPDTTIAKLGNRTAAELILQLETSLNRIDNNQNER